MKIIILLKTIETINSSIADKNYIPGGLETALRGRRNSNKSLFFNVRIHIKTECPLSIGMYVSYLS